MLCYDFKLSTLIYYFINVSVSQAKKCFVSQGSRQTRNHYQGEKNPPPHIAVGIWEESKRGMEKCERIRKKRNDERKLGSKWLKCMQIGSERGQEYNLRKWFFESPPLPG
jgi:hypothetical protein